MMITIYCMQCMLKYNFCAEGLMMPVYRQHHKHRHLCLIHRQLHSHCLHLLTVLLWHSHNSLCQAHQYGFPCPTFFHCTMSVAVCRQQFKMERFCALAKDLRYLKPYTKMFQNTHCKLQSLLRYKHFAEICYNSDDC